MYMLGRQRQINTLSIWDGREWSYVIDGDIRNSLLLSHILLIRYFTFLKGLMFDSP